MTERQRRTRLAPLDGLAQDLRYALRLLRRGRGFTAAAVATLALGIGAATVMFGVIDAVVLRPLPYYDPEQLVMVWSAPPDQRLLEGRSAYWNVEQWRARSGSVAGLAVFDPLTATLTTRDGAERISVARVSPGFFPMLGVHPSRGRTFSADEAAARQRLAVIGHRFWQTHFAGSPEAIGRSLVLDGRPSRIIGILPAGFGFARLDADVYEPHTLFADWEERRTAQGADSWFVLGRLRPDVAVDRAQAELNAIARSLDDRLPPAARGRGVRVVPLSHYVVGPQPRLVLWTLAAVVICVLLIAAANVASLSLARGVGRAREMAVRAALGASRWRIVRQLITENVVLALAAGACGVGLALAAMGPLRTFGPANLARLDEAAVDGRVLAGALIVSLLTGVLVGLAPAMPMWRRSRRSAALDAGRSVAGGPATRRIRRALVVGEFALAIVLLAGAGLLVRSWWQAERVHPGFRPERVLSMQLRTPPERSAPDRTDFYTRLLDRIDSLPGVEAAALAGELFIGSTPEQIVTAEGTGRATWQRLQVRRDEVSAGFFQALGTPLIAGRGFSARDRADTPPVAIVNETLARRVWPGLDPVGRRFHFGPPEAGGRWFTVVGVARDMRRQGLEREPIPQMFEPLVQNPSSLATLLVRTSTDDPLRMTGTIRAAVRQADPQVPLYDVATLEHRLGAFLAPRRMQTAVVAAFALVALAMAAIGIYGIVQFSVAARRQEIAIRMALGADGPSIVRMIVGEGLRLSGLGLALGLAGALWAGYTARSLLFGIHPADPVAFGAVSLVLIAVALAACYFPARRATKVEPLAALRTD